MSLQPPGGQLDKTSNWGTREYVDIMDEEVSTNDAREGILVHLAGPLLECVGVPAGIHGIGDKVCKLGHGQERVVCK